MIKLITLCGTPASGKTTLSKELAEKYNAKLYCFDKFEGAFSPSKAEKVRSQMHKDIAEDLRNGINVVCDDLNTKLKWRSSLLSAVSDIECKKTLVVMTTPLEVCLERNRKREFVLPDFVITSIHKDYEAPTLSEGWDEIIYY